MVVKVNMCDSTTANNSSSSRRQAQRVLRKYGLGNGSSVSKKSNGNSGCHDSSYWRLKRIVPAISDKENISKLDVVLEAINYIQALQGDLSRSSPSSPSSPASAAAAAAIAKALAAN